MLKFLFPGLTAPRQRGAALLDAITLKAREPHWYVAGEVPDTLHGRFRVLATLTALVLVRLEQEGEPGDRLSVALTERFIEVMESEHRELGLGDPTLGRTVRKLVGSLSRSVELWRSAATAGKEWNEAARESVYAGESTPDALSHSAASLRAFWKRLQVVDSGALAEGRIE
jgi:cytochrome b pre-mRNA-processing protein 3